MSTEEKIVHMYEEENLTFEEIASILGLPLQYTISIYKKKTKSSN